MPPNAQSRASGKKPVARSQRSRITKDETQDTRQMKMMRFILALPVADIRLLPKRERVCHLCVKPYDPVWGIDRKETAVTLPCGHIIGHFCIRQWLSPFELARTTCPVPGCNMRFPCPTNSDVSLGQSIVHGRLRPNKNFEQQIGGDDSSLDDYDSDDDDHGSVGTMELINRLANSAHALDVATQDHVRQIENTRAALNTNNHHTNNHRTQLEDFDFDFAESDSERDHAEYERIMLEEREAAQPIQPQEAKRPEVPKMPARPPVHLVTSMPERPRVRFVSSMPERPPVHLVSRMHIVAKPKPKRKPKGLCKFLLVRYTSRASDPVAVRNGHTAIDQY